MRRYVVIASTMLATVILAGCGGTGVSSTGSDSNGRATNYRVIGYGPEYSAADLATCNKQGNRVVVFSLKTDGTLAARVNSNLPSPSKGSTAVNPADYALERLGQGFRWTMPGPIPNLVACQAQGFYADGTAGDKWSIKTPAASFQPPKEKDEEYTGRLKFLQVLFYDPREPKGKGKDGFGIPPNK